MLFCTKLDGRFWCMTLLPQVTDSSGLATMARIEVVGRARDTVTTERGEYWRVLSPGR